MTNEYGFEIPLVSEEECKLQERIEELEKENEELKEINEGYCRNRDRLISMGFPTFKDCKEYAEHLTKAKEIIKKFLDAKNIEDTCVAESEAEHFLQELSELQTVSIDRSEI